MTEAGQQPSFYVEQDRPAVLTWLPILLGLLAAAIVALAFSPVPRLHTVSPGGALLLAITDVLATVGVGATVLAASAAIIAWPQLGVSSWRILPQYCKVAAWMTPVAAFYLQDSLWAVWTGLALSMSGSSLVYRFHLTAGTREVRSAGSELQIAELPYATRRASLTLAAVLLQLGILFMLASMARPATVLVGGATLVICCFHQGTTAWNQSILQAHLARKARLSLAVSLAIMLVAASLTPYLTMPTDEAGPGDSNVPSEHSTATWSARSAKPNASLLQSAGLWLRKFLTDNPQLAGKKTSLLPYPVLQVFFGKSEQLNRSESYASKQTRKGDSSGFEAGEVWPGMILRPQTRNYVTIVPPTPARWVFAGRPSEHRADPFSIPFYGAYWFFRAADRSLPADAVERHGDPAATSFKTTDYTPIAMEARQTFGSLIDLSCCRVVELVIANGDRRPGTVAVELVLTNTRLPGKPHQSLGIARVNSTLRWFPGDDRPPVTEVLSFRVPEQATILSFDEATVRFELGSPRERWSAMIAIESFRLIPRRF